VSCESCYHDPRVRGHHAQRTYNQSVTTIAVIIIVVLFVVPLVVVGASFVWAAKRDGEEDRALQARLGIRRRTRLGR
jgi:hypothetical protein